MGNPNDIIDDQIDVVTRAFLATSVACARCHDHKYDPVPAAITTRCTVCSPVRRSQVNYPFSVILPKPWLFRFFGRAGGEREKRSSDGLIKSELQRRRVAFTYSGLFDSFRQIAATLTMLKK